MTKYHINKHGVPAVCTAQPGNCPRGGDESHFDSLDKAEASVNKSMTNQYGILSTIEANEIKDIDGLLHYVEEKEILDEVLSRLDDEEIESISNELHKINGGYSQGIDNVIDSYNNSDFESVSEVIHDITGDRYNEIISELNDEYNIKEERSKDRSIGWTLKGMKHEMAMSTDADFKDNFEEKDINSSGVIQGSALNNESNSLLEAAKNENEFVVMRELGDHRVDSYKDRAGVTKSIDAILQVNEDNEGNEYLVSMNRNLVRHQLVNKMGLNKDDFPIDENPRKDFERIRETLNDDELLWGRLSRRLNSHEMLDEPTEDGRLDEMDKALGFNSREGFRQKELTT